MEQLFDCVECSACGAESMQFDGAIQEAHDAVYGALLEQHGGDGPLDCVSVDDGHFSFACCERIALRSGDGGLLIDVTIIVVRFRWAKIIVNR